MSQPYSTFQFLDHSGEVSSLMVHLPDVTNVNFDNTVLGMTDLRIAIEGLTLCTMGLQPEVVSEVHTDVATLPTDPYAQRERRAIFTCVDSVTGRKFKIGVPCPDLTDMGLPGTDAVNMSDVEVLAYLTALNLYAVSPEGNAFNVIKGVVEGRNV